MNLDITPYYGKKIDCPCGRTHFCPIEAVEVSSGALQKLPAILGNYKNIFLVADTHTWQVAGEAVHTLLKKSVAGILVYQRSGILVPDEEAVSELIAKLPDEADLILGIGSGVINDICKFVAWEKRLPSAIVATAPSMDGYASSGAAMITNGMKVTYTLEAPLYIVADTDIIKNAPMEMIRAGYGDIIGKYSSLNDWKLANLLNDEYFCQSIYDLVLEVTNCIRDSVFDIVARKDDAIELLMKALILIGITLSLVGSTRPGSGSEHHLGHFFEITGLVHHKPHLCHGIDVAYTTILTADIRHQICAKEPSFGIESPESRVAAWDRIFGPVAEEVTELQIEAGMYATDYWRTYGEKWPQILEILKECPTPEECAQMIRNAGFDMARFEDVYGTEKIKDAILYGKDLKNRYSVLWIYYALFSIGKEAVSWKSFSKN